MAVRLEVCQGGWIWPAWRGLTKVALPTNELLLITNSCVDATAIPKLKAPERMLSETSPPRETLL